MPPGGSVSQTGPGNFTNASNLPENYRPFFLTDLRVQWQKGGVTIFCDINKLFNTSLCRLRRYNSAGDMDKSGIKIVIYLRFNQPNESLMRKLMIVSILCATCWAGCSEQILTTIKTLWKRGEYVLP